MKLDEYACDFYTHEPDDCEQRVVLSIYNTEDHFFACPEHLVQAVMYFAEGSRPADHHVSVWAMG